MKPFNAIAVGAAAATALSATASHSHLQEVISDTTIKISFRPHESPTSILSQLGETEDLQSATSDRSQTQKTSLDSQLKPDVGSDVVRRNTLRIFAASEKTIIAQRNNLVDKKYSAGLTKSEQLDLDYATWKLDVIDDAKHGDAIDSFKPLVDAHRKIGLSIHSTLVDLKELIIRENQKSGKRRR